MNSDLRFNIADKRLEYRGDKEPEPMGANEITEFNHRHRTVLDNYKIRLQDWNVTTLDDRINNRSNLGAFRNRQIRESAILAAALSALAVGLHGFGSLKKIPKEEQTKKVTNKLKRANDRTAAQMMAEVLQTTTEMMRPGEEVVIASTITEGVRVKPGKEAGGNPTIAVGALFGKDEHRAEYGISLDPSVTMMSMGNDVIDGTGKSIKGDHSSFTALFLTESGVKRHLPDIYVQRWMSGEYFKEFNPREASLLDAAEIISDSYNLSNIKELTAYFLDRSRHNVAMDELNSAGICTPFDKDGDLFPCFVMGEVDIVFPDGKPLYSMVGEIGGSAEWAVGALPLIWRNGQAVGMLASQTTLTRKDLSPEEVWRERFHYTEDEYMSIQDARFEQKPYFTVKDIFEDPFAGGISAFGAISDNFFYPPMKGATADRDKDLVTVNVMTINSLGVIQHWEMKFKCLNGIDESINLMISPKEELRGLDEKDIEKKIDKMLSTDTMRKRFRIFYNNEYYPALIPVRDKMVLLHRALDALIERGALDVEDRIIAETVREKAPEWFLNSE
ncbi:MAG: fructose-bisphosphatase class II [candidate division Zixibacteria bacterium]|nr:fructose-bisphosphatase class II [candidate division Zixibacteria bacterium]